ncbi:DMT family transporter [Aestuariivirga sp.]|uniref:DMT family transporter n=1 Tax=Aestuariivirga sp. TaxID=2650926 RepID=UPI0025BD31D3|nr:DMT family transporter [Aestuariivirga sp.]MCA3554773.1 DMT family transporter [Aestuariivirga sp.]
MRVRSTASATIPVLVCTLAIFLLSAMDAGMKSLVLAAGVYNIVLWRSLLATIASAVGWAVKSRVRPDKRAMRLHALRAAIIGIVLVTFFWGLARLPLAEAIGLSFIAPLFALFLAALLLGERIRAQAAWAAVLGFAGVAVIVAGQFGGAAYSPDTLPGTLSILVSAVFYGFNLVLTRKQAQIAKPIDIMFFQNLCLLIIMSLASPWLASLLPRDCWLPLVGVTALSLTGQYLMSWSYARAEAQYLISTEYTAFIWAIALGWFFFGETVSWQTLAGAGLIIASCWIAARAGLRPAQG